jgi:predicted HTH transcriptional regulator
LSISNTLFDEICERDLQALVDTGVPEGHTIEYKSAMYGHNDDQVKEFLKDASSFANTHGGHLLIGIEEEAGVASRIAPIRGVDIDAEIARLENLLRDGLEPRILGIRVRAVPVSPTDSVIVVRVPRSWNPPHRVSARNWNRVFARNSAGAHEMSMEELRASFTMAATAYDRARAFRSERLAGIDAGDTPIPISPRPDRLVLHLAGC